MSLAVLSVLFLKDSKKTCTTIFLRYSWPIPDAWNDMIGKAVKETQVCHKKYQRLLIEEPSPGQELAGLWTGLYGTHGWEILTISYTDDQFIVATKVIGDANVPSGEITFKGNMGQVRFGFPNLLRIPSSRDQSRQMTKRWVPWYNVDHAISVVTWGIFYGSFQNLSESR